MRIIKNCESAFFKVNPSVLPIKRQIRPFITFVVICIKLRVLHAISETRFSLKVVSILDFFHAFVQNSANKAISNIIASIN